MTIPYFTATKNGITLNIYYDGCTIDPRESFDNLGTIYCWHRRYILGDIHRYRSPRDFLNSINKDDLIMLPVYMLDHSGIALSTEPFNDTWDSGQLGWIFVEKSRIRKEFGVKNITKSVRERVENILKAEIEDYGAFINGDCFWFELLNEKGDQIDSCSGFYGRDFKNNGILDCLGEYRYLLEDVV